MKDGDRRNGSPGTGAAVMMRLLVSGYLIYLGVDLIRDRISGLSTLPAGTAWASGALFIGAGLLFGALSWRNRNSGGRKPGNTPDEPSDNDDK